MLYAIFFLSLIYRKVQKVYSFLLFVCFSEVSIVLKISSNCDRGAKPMCLCVIWDSYPKSPPHLVDTQTQSEKFSTY